MEPGAKSGHTGDTRGGSHGERQPGSTAHRGERPARWTTCGTTEAAVELRTEILRALETQGCRVELAARVEQVGNPDSLFAPSAVDGAAPIG